nr:unnamed protein product [Callosobruchus chinensis]
MSITRKILEDVIDLEEQKQKINLYHETKSSHRGITKNSLAIKKHFYWPNLDIDVRNYVNSCEICQKSKAAFLSLFQAFPVTSLNVIETTSAMIQYFSNFGIPQKITCDNGSEWKKIFFKIFVTYI